MLLSVVYSVVNFLSRCRVTQATNTYTRSAKQVVGRTENTKTLKSTIANNGF